MYPRPVDGGARGTEIRLLLSLWIVFALFADPYTDGIHFKYLGPARALVEEGTAALRIERDPASDAFERNGTWWSPAAPVLSFLAVPHYLLVRDWTGAGAPGFLRAVPWGDDLPFRFAVLWGLVAPLAAYGGVLFHRLARSLTADPDAPLWWTLFFSLGTPHFFYACQVYDYALVSTAFLAALWFLVRGEERPALLRDRLAAGAWLGLAYGLNYSSTIGILLVAGVWAWRWRRAPKRLLPVAVGIAAAVLPVLLYHRSAFGGLFTTGFSFVSPGDFASSATPVTGVLPWLLHQEVRHYPYRLWNLTVGLRGIFVFVPLALAWPAAVAALPRRRDLPGWLVVAPLGATAYFLFNLMMGHGIWAAGTAWGPRYMFPGLAFFALSIAYAWTPRTAGFWKAVGGLSVLINWIGIQYGNSGSVPHHVAFFLLSGPTTPLHRWYATFAAPRMLERDVTEGLWPGVSGHFFALTHASPAACYLLLAGALWLIWRRPRSAA